MTLILALLLSIATPEELATKFCTVYLKQGAFGVLEGKARRELKPFLSKRLLQQADDLRACQADWYRQQPKGSTDKPPMVDCCLLSGIADGPPNRFSIARIETLPGARHRVVINYAIENASEVIRWRDALIITKESGRYVIDDIVFDVDADPPREATALSAGYDGCRGRKWVE
ncbi:MAG TPA: hypothetical protein VN181_15435 [Thermoanaerobaculia bacterium]|nr:hypothetical protein [Thermoanaerobaculia bacterium]